MDYREIVIGDVADLAKIYAETFNSDPWYDKWTHETAEKRLSQMISNGGFFGILSYNEEGITGMITAPTLTKDAAVWATVFRARIPAARIQVFQFSILIILSSGYDFPFLNFFADFINE